jgi:hypothetical protein
MDTFIPCPQCSAKLQVAENLFGRKIRCPACKTITVVPAPSHVSSLPGAADSPAPRPSGPPATNDEHTVPAPRGNRDGEGASKSKAVQPGPSLPPDAPSPGEAVPGGKRDIRKRKKKKKRKRSSSWLPNISVDAGLFKPILIVGFLVLLGAALIFGLRVLMEKGGAPPTIPPGSWDTYEVKDRFTALLPSPHRTEERSLQVLGGDAIVKVRASWPENESAANAIYTQWYGAGYSPNALPAARRGLSDKDLLNRICDDIVTLGKTSGDEELKRHGIHLGSYPGMELTVSVRHGKNVTRVYLAHDRIYLVAAGGRGIEPNQPNVKRLFESLQIVDTGKD